MGLWWKLWTSSPEICPPPFMHTKRPQLGLYRLQVSWSLRIDHRVPDLKVTAKAKTPKVSSRIHGAHRGHLVQPCTLYREGNQRSRLLAIYSKSDSPCSTNSHCKCRWCCPWQWKPCLARYRFFLGSVELRGTYPLTPNLHHPRWGQRHWLVTSYSSALPSALGITSDLKKRRLTSLLARIRGSDTVWIWHGGASCLVPVSCFLF